MNKKKQSSNPRQEFLKSCKFKKELDPLILKANLLKTEIDNLSAEVKNIAKEIEAVSKLLASLEKLAGCGSCKNINIKHE